MTYLDLVRKAIQRAGVREDMPDTLEDATGIVLDFKEWVDDTYRSIQTTGHADNWFFRQVPDQTLSLVAGTGSYSMPAGLADINWRTTTCYTVAKQDEDFVEYVDYYTWRMDFDTKDVNDAKPRYLTIAPDDTIKVYPAPDQAYTLRYDGVATVDSLADNYETYLAANPGATGGEGDSSLTPIIPERYQWVLVWGAVRRFAKHHEDGAKLADASDEYRPIYDAMSNWQLPDTKIVVGHLYGARRQYGR